MRTAAEYREALQNLLPPGAAWPRRTDADLTALLDAICEEFGRVSGRQDDLAAEVFPETTDELIAEWERALGLPDPNAPTPVTLAERRGAVIARLIGRGTLTEQLVISVAAALGYAVTVSVSVPVSEYGVMEMGDELIPDGQRLVWTVSGASGSLDNLLTALLEYLAPSHTQVVVNLS